MPTQCLKNYRPVSNLTYLYKLVERVEYAKLDSHLLQNQLHKPLQSAYKKYHSTETALLQVQDDILKALDKGHVCASVPLDLSAAFGTVDFRLHNSFGISGIALGWLKSHLTNRTQNIAIGTSTSRPCQLEYGVHQGSVLGPKLFNIYTHLLRHSVHYHFMPMTATFIHCSNRSLVVR